MGHKKRNPGSRPRQSPAAPGEHNEPPLAADGASPSAAVANGVAESPNPSEIWGKAESPLRSGSDSGAAASLAAARLECDKAMTAYRRGNHTKALRLMKELSQRHEGSRHAALILRVQGAVSVKVAAHIEDPATRNRHMRAALEAARRAAELSPSSIEFAYFHANLLYEVANEGKEYEEAVRECERGLRIDDPVDPAKDSLQEVEQKTASEATAEGRIMQVQNDLRQLIQKSNIASISSWMKNLGNGDEKFRLIPIRRAADDPMELRLVQSKRPNEIKKATKTPEERRKEIEVRVAVARLMQQKSEASPLENELDSISVSGHQVERRKASSARKNGSTAERRDFVKSFWNSISVETKQELLRIRVSDLTEHFGSSNEGLAGEVLSEALTFAKAHRSWKFWVCCKCNEVSVDSKSHSHHLLHEHIGTLLPNLEEVLPQNLKDDQIEMLLNYDWKPLDVVAAVKMISFPLKCKDDSFPKGDNAGDFDDFFKDTGDYPLEDNYTNCIESSTNEKILEDNGSVTSAPVSGSWPVSDDPECGKLLERIHALFEVLIKNKCFTRSLLSWVIEFAKGELQSIPLGSQLLSHDVEHSPAWICFLGDAQLKKIQKFLQEITHLSGLGNRYTEKSSNPNDSNTTRRSPKFEMRIALSEDSSFLLLDEGLLSPESTPSGDHHGSANNSANGILADPNSMLSWIFGGPTSGEELASWTRMKNEKAREGSEILQRLETEFYNLQSLCEQKCDHNSQLCDLGLGEDHNWRTKENLQQSDSVRLALQRQKLSKDGANLMRSVTETDQMELKLKPIGAHDYQLILLPLVKSYLRAHLEDLADKDATEKSDAAREAFLAELALDSKKQTQEKSKDKKKNKDSRKSRDSKVTGFSEPLVIHDETDNLDSTHCGSDDDHPDTSDFAGGNNSKRQQEEIRRKMELEEEERKLEETLEYQRRIENEAKEKHLAEQRKKANQTYLEKMTEGIHDLHINSDPADTGVLEPFKPSTTDLANNVEEFTPNHDVPVQSSTVPSLGINSIKNQTKILQSLPIEGISEDGYLPSDRRGGRRVKRQRGSAKVSDGKHLSSPSAKETVDVESSGQSGPKPLRLLHAEDDEERFQADLEKAVQQSLDTFQAQKKFPPVSSLKTTRQSSRDGEMVTGDVPVGNGNVDDEFGTGLRNEVGEYNCFLNVIIQSLWHIRRFRDEFLESSSSEHVHVGEPCVVCALYEIFSALSAASTVTRRESVSPTSLRVALSNLYPDSNFFQEAQMNDASEVLAVIFDCLHQSFTLGLSDSDYESPPLSYMGTWDCAHDSCIAHTIFGMDVFERMNCYNCALESRHLKYTTFFHNINASSLRTMMAMCPDYSFGQLLNLVQMNHQLACDPEAVGCGKLNHTHHILSTPPHVFTTVLGWQNTSESVGAITNTLAAINTEVDISVFYRGLEPKNLHSLVSVVCYYGQHYHCFAYSHDLGRWIMYDDQTVKVIGSWDDVLTMCEKGHLQPQVLFFEAVN